MVLTESFGLDVDAAVAAAATVGTIRSPGRLLTLTVLGLARRCWKRPVSLRFLEALRGLTAHPDGLSPPFRFTVTSGKELANPFLSEHLSDIDFGAGSLSARTLNHLGQELRRLKPTTVLEFGCGISTVCLARYLTELHGDALAPYVFAVEEDPSYARKTLEQLERLGLAGSARIEVVPLGEQVIAGRHTVCYTLSTQALAALLEDRTPDLIIVDGPALNEGVSRFGTLCLAQPALRRPARFLLDDALRDRELAIARYWERLAGVHIEGVQLVGKGLLAGTIDPAS